MTTVEGEEVATRDTVTGIVHWRLRVGDTYAVFHRNVGPNPFVEVATRDPATRVVHWLGDPVAPEEWCSQCVNRLGTRF